MVDVKDGMFQMQARTKLAKGEGSATVFVAAVAKEEDTSTVQVNLKDEGHLIVYINCHSKERWQASKTLFSESRL